MIHKLVPFGTLSPLVSPGYAGKEHIKLLKSKRKNKTQQSKGTLVQTSAQKSQQATRHARHKAYQLFLFCFFLQVWVFIIPNRVLLPTGPRDDCMLCPGWGRENSLGFFHGFMGPYFMGISYSVVQVIFKAASHPLIPLSSPHLTIGWKRFS